MKERNVLINSALIQVSSSVTTTIIHECGHFLTALYLGYNSTLFHNRVETPNESAPFLHQLLIPMAGPAISFFQGAVCMYAQKRVKNGYFSLALLWLGIDGLMGFFGYLFIAPFFLGGDTGKIFHLIGLPFYWQIAISIGAIVILFLMLLKFHLRFEYFIPENINNEKALRIKWARILIMYPVFIGIVFSSLLQLPIKVFLSLLPSITMPFMLFVIYGDIIMSKSKIEKEKNYDITHISIFIISWFVIMIVLNRLLTLGLSY